MEGTICTFSPKIRFRRQCNSLFSEDNIQDFHKGLGALQMVEKASKEKAIIALEDFPIMKSRDPEGLSWANLNLNDDMLVTIHILLEEVEYLPKIFSFKDVIQNKSAHIFKDFHELLMKWVIAVAHGDIKNERKIEKRSIQRIEA